MTDTFYVTTPIYYVNAKPHLGHLYTTVVADTIARFKRQRGVDAFFLTGTDEHGINIERAAAAANRPVQEHVDAIVEEFKAAWVPFHIDYNRWVRTTYSYHEEGVQKLWSRIAERGYIYKDYYEGWFCGNCNEFKDVDEGDEHPVCPEHDRPLDRISEESYFFKLSEFQQPLLDYYAQHPDFIKPEARRNEVVSFVSGGLKDLSVSRVSVKWGIPVPGDPKHTIYVWLDAVSNYITELGWGNNAHHDFERYWPAYHLIGKDILRFHAVYWPAWLMAAGIKLPRTVHAHGMWLSGGRKMSKTIGNTIDLPVLNQHFAPDMVRYFLLREMAFGQDGDFTYEALIDRVNSDLADGLGNLASRTLTMVRNYFAGRVPRPVGDDSDAADVRRHIQTNVKPAFEEAFEQLTFSRALEAAWTGIARVDKFITDNQPWKLAKDPSQRARLESVIATSYEGLRHIVLLVAPAIPRAAAEIWRQMGLPGDPLHLNPIAARWGEPLAGSEIDQVRPVFPKLAKETIMSEIEKSREGTAGPRPSEAVTRASEPAAEVEPAPTASGQGSGQPAAPSAADVITIDDFAKVALRAATVLEAERVPKADKLLRLIVDLGEEKPRQILAGIAQHYAPEDVVGRKIIVVANLAPRKLRGLESNGMLLAASVGEDGRPVLATFAEDVPSGTRLK